jgi:L-asparaginase/archaeal Glu-tRNAGln amidotransferase subunit D
MKALKRIALLSTGGTIASAPGDDGRSISGALPGEELLARTGLQGQMEVNVRSIFQKPSNAIGPEQWLALAKECQRLIEAGETDGIVITHGTDTLEDTAYYLECVLDAPAVPVVVTGSQRVPHALGSDAYANLRYAIELAASDEARGLGVLVSFNQSVFTANFVRKVSSFQLNGFEAPGLGALGFMDEGRFHALQLPMRQSALPIADVFPRTDILPVYGGADVQFARAVVESRPQALVIDGVGRGHVPPDWMDVLVPALRSGLPMVVCSATLHGATHQTYQFKGSLHEMEEAGAIGVSHLSARKARIRLALLIAAGIKDPDAIRQAFQWHRGRPTN